MEKKGKVRRAVLPRLHNFASGATRSEEKPSYHLVPLHGLRRTAQRFQLGAKIHGAENWKKAYQNEEDCAAWCNQAFDHMTEHAFKMSNGINPDDDHLGAIGWAQSVLAYAEYVFKKPWTELNK